MNGMTGFGVKITGGGPAKSSPTMCPSRADLKIQALDQPKKMLNKSF